MVPYLRAANVRDGNLDLTDVKEMNFTPREQKIFALQPGDVLVSEGSGSLRSVGASAVWHGELKGTVCFQNTLLRLRPRSLATDPRFLAWSARAAFASGAFASIASGANIFHISADRLRTLPTPAPPLAAQRAIAEVLDVETARIDALITKKRRLIELLLDRRATSTAEAVSGKFGEHREFVSSSLPWLEERPRYWTEVLLRLVAKLGTGHTPSRDHPEWWADCTIPWITTGEIHRLRSDRVEHIHDTREMISKIGLANSAAELHPANTVVLCRTASAGYSGIMGTPMATSQDFATWTCGPLLRPRFLLLCLRVMRQDLLGRLAMGSTHKTIYMPDIRSIRIPLPPVEEQDAIVEEAWHRLIPIDRAILALEQQIGMLQERRQALITAAVTGELDIPAKQAG